uniref:Uncharacterized protein n=1 Tax=Aegilops tauschii subsp. strangulata TaxID=200361 RepID=A0A453DXC9_AEGTS
FWSQPFLLDAMELKCCTIRRMTVWLHVIMCLNGSTGEVIKGCCCSSQVCHVASIWSAAYIYVTWKNLLCLCRSLTKFVM